LFESELPSGCFVLRMRQFELLSIYLAATQMLRSYICASKPVVSSRWSGGGVTVISEVGHETTREILILSVKSSWLHRYISSESTHQNC
jgi:hypothetical protein